MEPTTAAHLYSDLNLSVMSLREILVMTLILLPLAAVAGFWSGAWQRRKTIEAGKDVDTATGDTTLGAFLALLGLLLAFTFSNALSYSGERKSAMVQEATAIGTMFLRADLLAEPQRAEIQTLLLTYAKTRFPETENSIAGEAEARAFLDRTLTAQAELWPALMEATAEPVPAPVRTFLAAAMNDVIDSHLYRIAALSAPVSDVTNIMLLLSALTALFLLGNRAGTVGRKLTWRTFIFSGFLIVVISTIADTQRAYEGLVQIDDSPLRATIFEMELALGSQG